MPMLVNYDHANAGHIGASDLDRETNPGRIYAAEAATEVGHYEPKRKSIARRIAEEIGALWWVWVSFGSVAAFAWMASISK